MGTRQTVRDIEALYREGTPIAMATCYDYTFARLADEAGLDAVLIGDSLGNVIQGRETTLPVTLDEIIYHTRPVVRGSESLHVVADMPFMSYQADPAEGVRNAGRLLKEGGAQAVKIEGGRREAETIDRMVGAGIPVVGHLGLTPQSVHQFGGYSVQGREDETREEMLRDARALEDAGIYALVLEMVPAPLAADIADEVDVPTIGIGAGDATDGQVLVLYDLLGLDQRFEPSFVKRFADLEETVVEALDRYGDEVRSGDFPRDEHAFE
jgi:3-methyl-2-oxobutanoate hydroxymethyltransferase